MAKLGRPKKLDNIDLAEVEKLASLGLTDVEIAGWLGICRKTLSNYKKQEKEFLHTIAGGKLKADLQVVKSLYKRATEGNDTTAMKFWLMNRRTRDWRDKQEVEHSGGVKVIHDDI